MTFQLVPNSGQSLDDTRDAVRNNFSIIRTAQNLNHGAFDTANQGKHLFLQMPEQSAAPTTAVNEGGFYAKVGTHPAETNLFFRGENSGFEYQLTNAIAASTGRFSNNTNYVGDNNGGWTFLPGGMIMQYGRKTNPGASGSVVFPITFPSALRPFSLIVTNERDSARSISINEANINSTGFGYFLETGGSTAINWIAIGN